MSLTDTCWHLCFHCSGNSCCTFSVFVLFCFSLWNYYQGIHEAQTCRLSELARPNQQPVRLSLHRSLVSDLLRLRAVCNTDYKERRLVSAALLLWPPQSTVKDIFPGYMSPQPQQRSWKQPHTDRGIEGRDYPHRAALFHILACTSSLWCLQMLPACVAGSSPAWSHLHPPAHTSCDNTSEPALPRPHTKSFLPDTAHTSPFSVVQAGNPTLPSAGLITQMSYHPCLPQEDGLLPPWGTSPTLDSQCISLKKTIFGSWWSLSVARWHMLHVKKGSPP